MTLTTTAPPPPDEKRALSDVLETLGEGADPKLSMREIVEAFGERGFGALIFILSLMALFPWPPGGKALFSLPIILMAAEMTIQRDSVWLPRWALGASMSRATYRMASAKVLRPLRAVERLTRPRFPILTGEAADVLIGLVCIGLAVVLALPIPFFDAAPALTLAVIGLAVTQRDGLAVLVGGLMAAGCFGYLALVWRTVVAVVHAVIGWGAGLF